MDPLLILLVFGLPLLQGVDVPIFGAWATPLDLLAAIVLLRSLPRWPAWLASERRGPARAVLAFALWVGASALWGHHPAYAVAKGAAVAGWGTVALSMAERPVAPLRWIRVWCAGAVTALVLAVGVGVFAPEAVTWSGGSNFSGLPRMRAFFVHPNLLGDYLAVTAVLAIGASVVDPRYRRVAIACVACIVAAVSSAVVALAAAAILAGALFAPRRPRWGWIVVGAAVVAAVSAGAVMPLDLSVGGLEFTTTGLRLHIWAGAAEAIRQAPLLGVGAAPYLAAAVEPGFESVGPVLWDAHQALLSVLGQFGIVGLLLWTGMIVAFLRDVRRPVEDPPGGTAPISGAEPGPTSGAAERMLEWAVIAALLGAAAHGVFTASEEFRHLWVLLGLVPLRSPRRPGAGGGGPRGTGEPGGPDPAPVRAGSPPAAGSAGARAGSMPPPTTP